MSENSSSDDDWCSSTVPKLKCWECGKVFSNLTNLMSHYKSHDIKATCHICKITFRRLTSLTTHLDNVHSPPLCKKCGRSFSNVWEFNKHAEAHCLGSASLDEAPSLISAVMRRSQDSDDFPDEVTVQHSANSVLHDSVSGSRPQQGFEMKPERPDTAENSVEYIVGEEDIDMEDDFEQSDDSSSSEYDDEDNCEPSPPAHLKPVCSTDFSSDFSARPNSRNAPARPPSADASVCASCGKGPFKSIKLHLLHCSGVRVKYQCSLCKELFQTEASLNEHYMPLYSCEVCGQVFSHEKLYHHHQCPKGTKSPLVLFCSESMPQPCNICKLFFTSEKTLLDHVTRVHASVVSTKVCIITNPAALPDDKVSAGVHGTAGPSSIIGPNVVNQVINGNLCVGQTYAGSAAATTTAAKSSLSSVWTTSSHPGSLSAPPAPGATDATPASANANPVSSPTPTIMAMFENDSQDVALMKRMNTGWRAKAPHPCRQCGAILRQPSLIISHRYLHRGRHSHQCQCGRAFKHRLHLLRHCVQHAESVSYICVSCGETFTGAKLLAEHITGKSRKKSSSGQKWKHKVKKKCRTPFTCDCGQLFFRPSAYIWHQLQNRTKTRELKRPVT